MEKGKIGISNFGQKSIGDIKKVELPTIGDKFDANQMIGKFESNSNKFVIYSPLSMKILNVNMDVLQEPTLINQNADNCWFVEVDVLDKEELNELMNEKDYQNYLKQEGFVKQEED